MLVLETKTLVEGLTGPEIFEFLVEPSDHEYQQWWPGVHLRFHLVSRGVSGHVGDVLRMDEYVGSRRVRLSAVVVEAVPGERLVWQLKAAVRLPVWLSLEFVDGAAGVTVTHRIRAGWAGRGRIFDPLLRLYFSRRFAAAMDAHVHTEFRRLRERLHPAPAPEAPR